MINSFASPRTCRKITLSSEGVEEIQWNPFISHSSETWVQGLPEIYYNKAQVSPGTLGCLITQLAYTIFTNDRFPLLGIITSKTDFLDFFQF